MGQLKRSTVSSGTRRVPSIDSLPELLTVAELMRVARIGRTSAYEMVRSGSVPVIRFGRAIRVPRSALQHLSPPTL